MDIPNGCFGDSFIYVASLPKSASSLMWLIVSALQEESGRADPSKMPDMFPSSYQPLKLELMDMFPRGGTYSGHAPLNFDTNLFLRGLRCKYVIHLRHPADFIVAVYCHTEPNPFSFIEPRLLQKTRFGEAEEERWVYALSAIRRKVLVRDKTSIDEALTGLLREGPLFKAMEWMTDWLAHRDPELSTVSTYEALMTDFDMAINRLCLFVRGQEIDSYRLEYLKHVVACTADEGRRQHAERYPRGWTGTVGIWKSYFSEDHIAIYNETVKRFLFCYPNAEALLTVYKEDLLLT
jgi:hypothetical protein